MAPEGTEDVTRVPPSRRFLLALLLLLLGIAFFLVKPYLGALVLALLFGFLLHPLQRRLAPLVRWRTLSASILLLALTVAIVLPLVFIGQQLLEEAMGVARIVQQPGALEGYAANVLSRLGLPEERLAPTVGTAFERVASVIQGFVIEALASLPHGIASAIVFYFVLFFALRDGEEWLDLVGRLTPLQPDAKGELFALVGQRVRAITLGTFLVGVIQGVSAGLGWWFFGFPAPVFWGFVMTVIAVLPFGAPFLVMVPAGIFALATGNLFGGIGILVWAAVIVGLIDDVVRPWVVGRQAGVHPAIILVGTLGGLQLFGIAGFLLGPLLLSMVDPVLAVWAGARREARPMPPPS